MLEKKTFGTVVVQHEGFLKNIATIFHIFADVSKLMLQLCVKIEKLYTIIKECKK